ncbi:MAG: hypothetical protein ACJAW1_002329, partial [Glaciecola sp.]
DNTQGKKLHAKILLELDRRSEELIVVKKAA